MAPKVSVIIPCFNLGQFLEETVDSVLTQTDQDFEVVIVNDGSTDERTNAILRDFQRPRTTVLSTDNQGLAAARNLAIEHSQGKYICALDADDKLHPRFLEKTTAVLEADPSVTFVSTWLETFGTESWVWRQERCDFPTLLAECVVLTASPVRREAVDAVGGYDNRLSPGDEDWDLWISLVEQGFRGTILPEVLFYYRRRPGSMSTTPIRGAVRMRLWENMLRKHRAAYDRYLPEVLLHMERECGRILRDNWLLQHEIEGQLRPQIRQERAALDRLNLEVQAAQARQQEMPAARDEAVAESQTTEALRRELQGAHAEIQRSRAELETLRSSRSWQITAPLRRGYDHWITMRGRLGSKK